MAAPRYYITPVQSGLIEKLASKGAGVSPELNVPESIHKEPTAFPLGFTVIKPTPTMGSVQGIPVDAIHILTGDDGAGTCEVEGIRLDDRFDGAVTLPVSSGKADDEAEEEYAETIRWPHSDFSRGFPMCSLRPFYLVVTRQLIGSSYLSLNQAQCWTSESSHRAVDWSIPSTDDVDAKTSTTITTRSGLPRPCWRTPPNGVQRLHGALSVQQSIHLTGAFNRIEIVAFILANGWARSPFPPFYEQAKAKDWKTLAMACGHDVMLNDSE